MSLRWIDLRAVRWIPWLFVCRDLTPSIAEYMPRDSDGKYTHEAWNDLLPALATTFAETHPDSTVLIYSSYDTFTRIMENPTKYGFNTGDEFKPRGSIWYDQIHPTSKMHDEIANDLLAFLSEVKRT